MPLEPKKYEPLLAEGKDEIDCEHHSSPSSADYRLELPMNHGKKKDRRTIKILVALNVGLAALLLLLVVVVWREKSSVPARPYSPAWQAVRYVNKRFQKDERFWRDDELDPEIDQVWLNLTGPSNGHIKLDAEEAKKNVPTLELYFDPGHYLYGLNMFHQLHCLDAIRKSFFPEHYFPDMTPADVRKHKQHCFDFLRQSIMCSGDVTLDHWFNYTWTEPPSFFAEGGQGKQGDDWMGMLTSQEYTRLTLKERAAHAPLMWDTTHQCRDYDALYAWVKEREVIDEKYDAGVIDRFV